MTNLLIHSMSEFSDIITAGLDIAGVKRIVEIGAEFGGTTSMLADHATAVGGELISVDPEPKQEFIDWCAANRHVRHVPHPSLAVIDDMADVDAWVIDGDHNWFTVYHELKAIDAVCRRDGKPLLTFMHDVCWPWARRDSYYVPDRIPAAHRQPFDYHGGVTLDRSALVPHRGFRSMGQYACAVHEGGPKNGVKTAIEDFVAEDVGPDRQIAYAEVPAVFGMGVLFDLSAPWADAMATMLVPLHENKLLAALERNRLANYLNVIEWQDRHAEDQAKITRAAA